MTRPADEIIASEWPLGGEESVILHTHRSSRDSYSERVRTDWSADDHVKLAAALLSKGEMFVDLGANIGTFCAPVAVLTGARFIAVEALAENVDLLRATIAANGLDGRVEHVAVSDQAGTVRVRGESAFGIVGDEGAEVRAATLDQLMENAGWPEVSLVKIDIEGSEMRALSGATEFIGRNNQTRYIFEANAAHCWSNGYRPQDLLAFFEALGLHIYLVRGGRIVRRTSHDVQEFGLADYLATPEPLAPVAGFSTEEWTERERVSTGVRTLTAMKPGYRKSLLQQMELAPAWFANHTRIKEAIGVTSETKGLAS